MRRSALISASSSSTFILAGMDTTSNATARLLHLLAAHSDVQNKLREEILEAQAGEAMSYEQIMGLPYLDAVCRETLRLYVRTVSVQCFSAFADHTSLQPCSCRTSIPRVSPGNLRAFAYSSTNRSRHRLGPVKMLCFPSQSPSEGSTAR